MMIYTSILKARSVAVFLSNVDIFFLSPFLDVLVRDIRIFFYERSMVYMYEEDLYYDTNEAIKFISEQTGIDQNIVAKVLDADVEFMRKIGIIKD